MEGPLAVNLKPESFDVPDFGKIYVSGAVTAIALADTPYPSSEKGAYADLSNAQVFVQKVDGAFQFFLDAGTYSFPTVGVPYTESGSTNTATFGALPLAFLKYVNGNFSIQAGKLPTLIGAEYGFTYENMNISRGLLWNQEPLISRGVQANYTAGPVLFNVSWNDGFYSNRFNWVTGAATWTINTANTLEVVGGGNLGTTDYGSSATPEIVNNDSEIVNLIFVHIRCVDRAGLLPVCRFGQRDGGRREGHLDHGRWRARKLRGSEHELEPVVPRRGHHVLGQRHRRIRQPALRPWQQSLFVHVHAHVPVGRLLHPGRGLDSRGLLHDARRCLREDREQHIAGPVRDRDRHFVLNS